MRAPEESQGRKGALEKGMPGGRALVQKLFVSALPHEADMLSDRP